ncbi:unfolded protein response sensor protein [Xylariales sp. AK1849]|nr:unfolded protein response sensor protein [Xylariales sp. AK1849]
MVRRPPGEGRLVAEQRRANKVVLALAILILPWLSLADAQQQQQQHSIGHQQPPVANVLHGSRVSEQQPHVDRLLREPGDKRQHNADRVVQHESPFEAYQVIGKLPATISQASASHKSTSLDLGDSQDAVTTAYAKQKESHHHNYIDPNDASALATLAPDYPVRAAKTPRQLSSILGGGGLSSPQSARSLGNWEVEDYVLLATVDGNLYAVSKESGDERWRLQVEQPTVETIHHRPNISQLDNYEHHDFDDYIWAVEPTHNGPVYVWRAGSGLTSIGYTMKELVDDFGHLAAPDRGVVYTGDKKNQMVNLDAATGGVLKWWGQGDFIVNQNATCFRPKGFVDEDSEKCANTGTITLSRTEYTVSIHRLDDGRPIATLRYHEWGPNNFDQDLHRQYQTTQDNRYLTSRHDGKLYALNDVSGVQSLHVGFSAPVARVFDVARPYDIPKGSNPELVLLPQPKPPARDMESVRARSSSIFLNRTESGSWYALSGSSYPLILEAPFAQINEKDWMDLDDTVKLDEAFINEALIGTHSLGDFREDQLRGIERWPSTNPPSLPPGSMSDTIGNKGNATSLGVRDDESDLNSIVEKVKSVPDYALSSMFELWTNPIFLMFAVVAGIWFWNKRPTDQMAVHRSSVAIVAPVGEPTKPADHVDTVVTVNETNPTEAVLNTTYVSGEEPATAKELHRGFSTGEHARRQEEPFAQEIQTQQPATESPEKKKKKNHRGTRGGVKHRNRKKQDASQSPDDNPTLSTADPVQDMDKMIQQSEPRLKPNVKSVVGNPEDISTAGFEINGLRVNLDEQLGMGSNGTVVFPGTFHQREVAVKRMLAMFYDIASQETQLLLESDNHPNVIQYYAFHRDNTFLYIALERCHASLADIVDKPHMHKDLAQAGEQDIPNVLLQIANGLSHLHGLRIVHRDLKPQNILVTMTKDGKPRLVVSDFGLCKKLDGAQSSFGATTAHAAGTSGWRAPELLLDDDARENSNSMGSMHSESSQLVSSDLMPNRRATRAIDIFSLGLVFFYVLTKGSHPFDCGDRYMREVNIRKGQLNLTPLDVLGDFAFEARDLISNMLNPEPRCRPNTREVMAHPFFWDSKKRLTFLCDVSDHFEKEQRDPPSLALQRLESYASLVCRGDFLKALTKDFVESLGKQRKYTGTRLLDLLRALRNKWNHREDMSEPLKKSVGTSHEDYLGYWTRRFPNLLVICCEIVFDSDLQDAVRFKEYFEPMKP